MNLEEKIPLTILSSLHPGRSVTDVVEVNNKQIWDMKGTTMILFLLEGCQRSSAQIARDT
jgi:hypothetical protein